MRVGGEGDLGGLDVAELRESVRRCFDMLEGMGNVSDVTSSHAL